ncbi:MAG TPA: alpha/beta hydrolase [Amycolatopsis sp.]|nr:alpha/beta hydrolase [Amycolatopsis sp.]
MTEIEEITPEMIERTWSRYAPLHRARAYQAPKVDRDLRYGPHERHRLDVHTTGDARARPVLVFVHGGGFVGGDKHLPGTPFYDHIGGWAVDRGMIGVTMTYRLAPEYPWPAGADDVGAALDWVRRHAADYGGDPDRIVLMGHSAGASHVACRLAMGESALSAAVLLSGIYDLGIAEPNEPLTAYFGTDAAARLDRSPLPGLLTSKVPMLFGVAEGDPRDFQRQLASVAAAFVAVDGILPALTWVPGHQHISEIASLGVDDTLGETIRRFAEQHTGGPRR